MPTRKKQGRATSRRRGEDTPASLGCQGESPNYSGVFGAGFAAFRKARGCTQADIAAMVDRTESAVGEWERGESSPSVAQIAIIAHALNCPVTVLVAAAFGEAKAYRGALIECLHQIETTAHSMRSLLDGDLDHDELPRRWAAEPKGKYGKMA